jgi:hypothetical protein
MLAHSPVLPLIINCDCKDCHIPAKEEGVILALEQCDRVCHVCLHTPALTLQKFIMAINNEYPVLGYLIMELQMDDMSTALMPPGILQALHLHHLVLVGFALPTRSRLLTTTMGLVMLALTVGHPPTYFPAKYSTPMAFIHATAGDACDQLFIPCSQP